MPTLDAHPSSQIYLFEKRLASKIEPQENGCWLWNRKPTAYGYGQYWNGHTMAKAHRHVWECLHGAIKDALELDHLCRVRLCVNPAHLEPVTTAENLRRSGGNNFQFRDACKWGHTYKEGSFRIYNGGRFCLVCDAKRGQFRTKIRRIIRGKPHALAS